MGSILLMSKNQVRSQFAQRTVTTIRLNNLASDPNDIYANLLMKGLLLEEVAWAPYTYIVPNKDKSELGKMVEYERGLFYIQNLSSMLAVVALDPSGGDKVLDMCAAPGSKTSYIASLTNNKAKITAVEEDHQRIAKLNSVMSQFHLKNVEVFKTDGGEIGKSLPGRYEKVLLDAPCTGEGLIYLQSDNPLRYWNIRKIKRMVSVQRKLILSAFDSLKVGGTLIYSTCTLEPDENEGIITYLLENRDNVRIQTIDIVNSEEFTDYKPFIKRGITKWSGNRYHQECGKCIRVIPGPKMQGFFICRITKT